MAPLLYVLLALFHSAQCGVKEFDCPMRQLALEFAINIQPWLSQTQLNDIADALNGSPEAQNCSVKPPNNGNIKSSLRAPIWSDIDYYNDGRDKDIVLLFVDYNNGNDSNDGSIYSPLKNVESAVFKTRESKNKNKSKKVIILRGGTHYLTNTLLIGSDDNNLLISNFDGEEVTLSAGKPLNCQWKLWKKGDNGKNFYNCSVDNSIKNIFGLRVNGSRAIRARYPNANPELGFGSDIVPLAYLPPTLPDKPDYVYNPEEPDRNNTDKGYFSRYNLGFGGPCINFEPYAGYWCSDTTQGGGPALYTVPSGISYDSKILPNTPYSNPEDMVIQAWRQSHWASWMFTIGKYDPKNKTYGEIIFDKGGFQGARGHQTGQQFYVENVMEELDYPSEWFYNRTTNTLYYYNNATSINDLVFEITNLKVLVNYTGTMDKPVKNQEIRGITMKDTAYTYMDPHGMPSGGDWALQRTGAIYLDGVENIMIQSNLFSRLDGNVISINRYARNVTIYKNEMVWIGDNVVSNWGDTAGISFPDQDIKTTFGVDGTTGIQPRFINMTGNLVHEIGIWEKQSSMYFQAQSCSNWIYGNIFYNGPRAGINFNDGFGGNSSVGKNLLFNTCRESADHGNMNTWDRQVYVTKVKNGQESVYKEYDYVFQNFWIANYNAESGIDNDDGSAFYKTYNNFQPYGNNGLKSGHGGNSNYQYGNIYAYIKNGWQTCFDITRGGTDQLAGYNDGFYNNTCIFNANVANYGVFNCDASKDAWPVLGGNKIHTLSGSKSSGLCNLSEEEFQKKYNVDLGTEILGPPNDTLILQQAKAMLFS